MLLRILLSLPLWLAYTALTLVTDLIGLVILLPLSLAHAWRWRPSKIWPDGFQDVDRVAAWRGGWLTWLWGNEEDGVVGAPWWRRHRSTWPSWKRAYVWSALRNPSNNLRFIPGINPVIDPKRVRFLRRLGWNRAGHATEITLTWQGPFSGLLIVFPFLGHTWRFWLGWKLKPEDASGVDDSDMRKPRCGFARQLKRIS